MSKKKKVLAIIIAIIIFILSLGLTLYPVISINYSEKHQSEIHTSYEKEMEVIDNSAIIVTKETAIKYNEQLVPGVRNVEAFSSDGIEQALETYGDQLNHTGNGIMGYIEIPKMKTTLPIYHGTNEATLELGIGHLVGSSLPIGGKSTHSILTGHSGMANQKMFSDLPELKIGDVFYIDILNETLAYQVDHIVTVLPEDTSHLQIEQGEDYCTLITCTPFGINTHRLLVRGARIPYVQEEKNEVEQIFQEEKSSSTWVQQYALGLILGVFFVILAAILAIIINKNKEKELSATAIIGGDGDDK